MADTCVRPPGAGAAGVNGFAHSSIACAPRTTTFALPHAAFAALISACASSRSAGAKSTRTSAEATSAFATLHASLAEKPNSQNSLDWTVHELAYPMLLPLPSGRRSGDALDLRYHAAEWRPTTARPKGGRSVV